MSLSRWGVDGSHVYVIEAIDDGMIECVGCPIPDSESSSYCKPEKMIEHLKLHQARGDHVPEYVFAELENRVKMPL